MNPVLLTLQLIMTAAETYSPPAGDAPTQTINHTGFNYSPGQLNAASTAWPVSGCAYLNVPVGNATVTIDLTNLTIAINGTQSYIANATGLKVRGVIMTTMGLSNVANITVQPGTTNPYTLDGSSYQFVLGPSEVRPIWKGNNAPTVSAGVKTIKFTGTNAGDSINLGFIFG
jgi:hypothetical protein